MDSEIVTIPRVGEQSYWMSRYLERGESLARMLSATHLLSLDYKFHLSIDKHPLLYFLLEDKNFSCEEEKEEIDDETIQNFLVYHNDNPTSLTTSFQKMRRNGKLIREILGDQMWQTINDLYHWLNHTRSKQLYNNDRFTFYKTILDSCLQLKGLFYDSFPRDEYYNIMEMGIMIERANLMINVIDKLTRGWLQYSEKMTINSEERLKFYHLLLECGASRDSFFRKSHSFEPESLVKFFIYEKFSPYSLQYCLNTIATNLTALFGEETAKREDSSLRAVQKLQESLSEKQIYSISLEDVAFKTGDICKQLREINETVNRELSA